jgi:hypothetical protein
MNYDDSIKHSLSKNVLRLGYECRDLAIENALLRAEVVRLKCIILFWLVAVTTFIIAYNLF